MIDLDRITQPLRLARGSHQPGSGKGCAMNVISYINGDSEITDYPECSARPLSRLVQAVNDVLADRDGLLSPDNSVLVLDLGWLTVGTAGVAESVVWQWLHDLLIDSVHGVVQYARTDGVTAIRRVAGLCARQAAGEVVGQREWREERVAANAAANAYAYAAADAAAYADADAYAYAYAAANAYDAAANAAAYAAAAANAYARQARIDHARWAIQHWRNLAGLDTPTEISPSEINTALQQIHA